MGDCNLLHNAGGVLLWPLTKRDKREKIHVTSITCILTCVWSTVSLLIHHALHFYVCGSARYARYYATYTAAPSVHSASVLNVWYVTGIFITSSGPRIGGDAFYDAVSYRALSVGWASRECWMKEWHIGEWKARLQNWNPGAVFPVDYFFGGYEQFCNILSD